MADQDVDTTAAALALQAAVDQLTQPGVVQLQRDIPQPGTTAWQLMADDKALEQELHGQLAQSVDLARQGDEKTMAADEWWRRSAGKDVEALAKADQLADEAQRLHQRATRQAERAHEGLRHLDARRAARTRTDAPTPSLLDQLLEEIPNSSGGSGGRTRGGSRMPLAADALDIARDIALAVGQPLDPHLAYHVRRWADDAHHHPDLLALRADKAAPWPDRIRDVLNPTRPWRVAGRCPDCGNDTAWIDQDGEKTRLPAIELDRDNNRARCLCCPARWRGDAALASLEKVLRQQQDTEKPRLRSSREGCA